MTNAQSFQSQSLSDWLFYLESQHCKEIDLGLERVIQVAKQAEVLELNAEKVVLVAGTNGKGTTIRFMEQYLIAQGASVGVYSSPHLFSYNERVRINGKTLSDELHVNAFQHIENSRNGCNLTYFEFGTLAAYKLFTDLKLDCVLIEVGLGGRLDATNILEHDLAVITTLGLDHTDWLGDTIEQIGYEKAGIFKTNKPAVVGLENAPNTVFQQAEKLQVSAMTLAGEHYQVIANTETWQFKCNDLFLDELPKPLIPIQNIATALASLITLEVDITQAQVAQTIQNLSLTGRMQILSERPCAMVDVAHNPQSVGFLVEQLMHNGLLKDKQLVYAVVAMMKDKDIKQTLHLIKDQVDVWLLGDLNGNDRAETAKNIKEILLALGQEQVQVFQSIGQAWQQGKQIVSSESLLLGFGSFYTVAEILQSEQLTEDI